MVKLAKSQSSSQSSKNTQKAIVLSIVIFIASILFFKYFTYIFSAALIIGAFIFVGWVFSKIDIEDPNKQRLAKYENAKLELRKNPKSVYLREQALKCGREYYAGLRFSGRLTIYDEQALNNDLLMIIDSETDQ